MTGAVVLVVLAVLLWPTRGHEGREDRASLGAPRRVRALRRAGAAGWRARPRTDDDGWVADLAEVVVVGLDAGLDLPRAVLTATRSPTVARRAPTLSGRVADAVESGESVARCLGGLEDHAGPGHVPGALRPREAAEVDVLVRSWLLSERAGAAASTTTAAAAVALRARRADRERARALAAGPRASMWLLTALPLLGPGIGLLVGVEPGRLYGSEPARVGALAGVLFTVGGWAWAGHILRRAHRPATTEGRAG